MLNRCRTIVFSEFRQVEQALDDRVHVAAIAQIFHASQTWTEDGNKSFASLNDLGEL